MEQNRSALARRALSRLRRGKAETRARAGCGGNWTAFSCEKSAMVIGRKRANLESSSLQPDCSRSCADRRPRCRNALVDQNCLPAGRTFRGGLSMRRLNFLEEVKTFVRKWSCRPRWPGDVRRLSREHVFGVQDTGHLNRLRENRVKLLAHCIVARTLGFEQDLRRGIWRYRDTATGALTVASAGEATVLSRTGRRYIAANPHSCWSNRPGGVLPSSRASASASDHP